jgi:hypothetical protein
MTTAADLFEGEPLHFSDWPDKTVPKGPPGVYTIWNDNTFLYVGMSWREPTRTTNGTLRGLWGRLKSHASGRRSGDQFCIYICDQFVIASLSPRNTSSPDDPGASTRRPTERPYPRPEDRHAHTHATQLLGATPRGTPANSWSVAPARFGLRWTKGAMPRDSQQPTQGDVQRMRPLTTGDGATRPVRGSSPLPRW